MRRAKLAEKEPSASSLGPHMLWLHAVVGMNNCSCWRSRGDECEPVIGRISEREIVDAFFRSDQNVLRDAYSISR